MRYVAIRQDERLILLKRKFAKTALFVVSAFLAWYFLYVAASAFARGLMGHRLFGNVNAGLVLGVAQFASTFALAWLYARRARRGLDPLAAEILADADRRLPEDPAEADRRPLEEPMGADGRSPEDLAEAGGRPRGEPAEAEGRR